MQLKNPGLLRDRAFFGGEWQTASTGRTFAVTNPATGEIIGQVPDLGVLETRTAIELASRAFVSWRAQTAHARAQILRRWFDLILIHQEDLAQLMTAEQGKSLTESRGEVTYGAAFVEWFSEEAKRVYGDVIAAPGIHQKIIVLKEPVGVVAAITPWNFPLAMITRKVAPALAAGCPVVIKPAEDTPLSALALAVLAEEAGFPVGTLQVLTTRQSSEVGRELCENPLVRKNFVYWFNRGRKTVDAPSFRHP